MLDRVDAELDVVLRGRFLHRDVRRRAQSELVRLVHDRLELIAIHPDDLQSVGALLLDLADPGADLGWRSAAALADERVHQNAGGHDGVRVALGLPPLRLVEIAAHFPHSGHACREVEVALVLNRLRHAGLALFVPVHVRVDDAGHHVLAGGVDHRVGGRPGDLGRSVDGRDESVPHDDVHGSVRRLGIAVDHHGVSDDETPSRLGVNGRRLRLLSGGGSKRQQRCNRESGSEHLHAAAAPRKRRNDNTTLSARGTSPACDGKVPVWCSSR